MRIFIFNFFNILESIFFFLKMKIKSRVISKYLFYFQNFKIIKFCPVNIFLTAGFF